MTFEKIHLGKAGFTLVEVVLASTIGAFIALIAVGTLKTVTVGAEIVNNNSDIASEVRFASGLIQNDLSNFYWDRNFQQTKFVAGFEQSGSGSSSLLTFYTVSKVKARAAQPENDVYEVSYFLLKENGKSLLMRRFWPNPDKNAEPAGILTPIAEGIDVFEARFFDGRDWFTEWPEDARSLPQLVEVMIAARQPDRADIIKNSFIVNIARSKTGSEDALEQLSMPED